jgi:hypothetical protein
MSLKNKYAQNIDGQVLSVGILARHIGGEETQKASVQFNRVINPEQNQSEWQPLKGDD